MPAREPQQYRSASLEEADALLAFSGANHLLQTLSPLLDMFKMNLFQFSEDNPMDIKSFQAHSMNAHIVASSDVQAYDIIRWFTDIPQSVRLPLNGISRYYHKEAVLRSEPKHAERRCEGGHLSDDEEYAAERVSSPHFGFEKNSDKLENGFDSVDAAVVEWLLLAKAAVTKKGGLVDDHSLSKADKDMLASTLRGMEKLVRAVCRQSQESTQRAIASHEEAQKANLKAASKVQLIDATAAWVLGRKLPRYRRTS
ncbi:hypothetical protein LTR85_008993 [Meristemomyces frigidus]|nr:hypothetical protein LTR85_008993 [Meristemomyces frigidus]